MTYPRQLAVVAAAVLCLLGIVPAAAHATAARALVDPLLTNETADLQAKHMQDIARLRARYVRLELSWAKGEPAAGVYDEAYFSKLDGLVDLAAASGIRIVFTVVWVPRWASDSSLWSDPPANYSAGYRPFYAPKDEALDDFRAFCAYAASRLDDAGDTVFAYECWNEPNLWPFFYPQENEFAINHYFQLLRRCYNGVNYGDGVYAGDPDALVIAGATGPVGFDDEWRTNPESFAKGLRSRGASEYMDAYSHHPYVPGGTDDMRPEARPDNPTVTVSLSNIDALLTIFPGKDFYLTEYGYNTAQSNMFSATPVSQATQADYLRRAYRMASRHSQIKALFWYLRRDASPSGKANDHDGVFTGLRMVTETRKRSWFAFAGGMRLTISAPRSVRTGSYAELAGQLTCSRLATATSSGGLARKALLVQRRASGHWTTIKSVATRSEGRYVTWVKMNATRRLRLVWQGVVASPSRLVETR